MASAECSTQRILALWKRGDTQLCGCIRDECDALFRLIAGYGTLRQRVSDTVFRAPLVELARLNAEPDWSMAGSEWSFADLGLRDCNALGWRIGIDLQGIIPCSGGKDLPVGGHAALAQLDPAFADAVREYQGAALDGDGVMEPAGEARRHGEGNFDAVAGVPAALNAGKGACSRCRLCLTIDGNDGARCPGWNAKLERKPHGRGGIDCEPHRAVEGIA